MEQATNHLYSLGFVGLPEFTTGLLAMMAAEPPYNAEPGAIEWASSLVNPTSDNMIYSYLLNCLGARTGDSLNLFWNDESHLNDPEWLTNLIRRLRAFQKLGTERVIEGEELPYRWGIENETFGIWIPKVTWNPQAVEGMDKKTIKQMTEVFQRNAKDMKPFDGKISAKERLNLNPLSPLTEYYLMRYLGPWLVENGAANAMPFVADPSNPYIAMRRMDIERVFDQNMSSQLLDGLMDLAFRETDIDEAFGFERLRTTYQYPENYGPQERVYEVEGTTYTYQYAPEPSPFDANIEPKYGMLQKMYAVLSTADRKRFVQGTFEEVVGGAEHRSVRMPAVFGDALQDKYPNKQTKQIPFGEVEKGHFTEAAIVWMEANEAGGFQAEGSLKLPMDTNDVNTKDLVSEGGTIEVPALIAILAEKKGNHRLYESYLTSRGRIPNITALRQPSLNELEGTRYLQALARMVVVGATHDWVPDNYEDLADDEKKGLNEEAIRDAAQDFLYFLGNMPQYEWDPRSRDNGTIREVGEITASFSVDPKVISKPMDKDSIDRALKVGEDAFDAILNAAGIPGVDPYADDVDWSEDGDGVTPEPSRIIEMNAEGADNKLLLVSIAIDLNFGVGIPKLAGARAFNALGLMVEDQMVRSARLAMETTDMPKSSDFDLLIAGLIGNAQHPGLAAYHAAMHNQYLVMQLKSPERSFDFVDTKSFDQGRLESLISFLDQPAKKALYWMLNERGYIDVGDFSGSRPKFFRPPQGVARDEAKMAGLKNAFSSVVIGYYRLLFSQLRHRRNFQRSGTERAKSDESGVLLSRYWKDLIADALNGGPDPSMFGMVLRLFARSEPGKPPVLRVPTSMPIMPDDMRDNAKPNRSMVSDYLKWAYSQDPLDTELFAETAAAYHAAKALSAHRDYPEMVERFVEAVAEDRGSAFLFAILQYDKTPNLQSEPIIGKPVEIVGGIAGFPSRPDDPPTPPEPAPPAAPASPAAPIPPEPLAPAAPAATAPPPGSVADLAQQAQQAQQRQISLMKQWSSALDRKRNRLLEKTSAALRDTLNDYSEKYTKATDWYDVLKGQLDRIREEIELEGFDFGPRPEAGRYFVPPVEGDGYDDGGWDNLYDLIWRVKDEERAQSIGYNWKAIITNTIRNAIQGIPDANGIYHQTEYPPDTNDFGAKIPLELFETEPYRRIIEEGRR